MRSCRTQYRTLVLRVPQADFSEEGVACRLRRQASPLCKSNENRSEGVHIRYLPLFRDAVMPDAIPDTRVLRVPQATRTGLRESIYATFRFFVMRSCRTQYRTLVLRVPQADFSEEGVACRLQRQASPLCKSNENGSEGVHIRYLPLFRDAVMPAAIPDTLSCAYRKQISPRRASRAVSGGRRRPSARATRTGLRESIYATFRFFVMRSCRT